MLIKFKTTKQSNYTSKLIKTNKDLLDSENKNWEGTNDGSEGVVNYTGKSPETDGEATLVTTRPRPRIPTPPSTLGEQSLGPEISNFNPHDCSTFNSFKRLVQGWRQ